MHGAQQSGLVKPQVHRQASDVPEGEEPPESGDVQLPPKTPAASPIPSPKEARGEPFKVSNSDTEPLLEKVAESPEKVKKSPTKGSADTKQDDAGAGEGKSSKP